MAQSLLLGAGKPLLAGGKPLLLGSAPNGGGGGGGASGLSTISLVASGQSNQGYSTLDGAGTALVQALAFYLGAAAGTYFSSWGSNGSTTAITAAIVGNQMAVSTVGSGIALGAGSMITDFNNTVSQGTAILSQSSGTTGGPGVYVLNNSANNVATQAMFAVSPPNSSSGYATEVSGIGIFEIATPTNYNLAFLANPQGAGYTAAGAAAAPLGICGVAFLNYLNNLTSGQRAQILGMCANWDETESLEFGQSNKAVDFAAKANWIGKVRGMLSKTAAQFPVAWWDPPYGGSSNSCTMRENLAALAADPAQNLIWAVQQTYDTISRSESWDASTGVASGGNTDGGHRSAIDNLMLYKRAALPLARAILASNGLSASLIPSALGTGLGPQVTAANLSGTTLTLTVTHDGGNDLVVPLLASQGVGFSVMDGGTIASPGAIIKATSCTRVDATHLSLTLASAPSNPHTSCRFFYPWPGTYWGVQPDAEIGRGCAVTDNFASVTKPSGFDINASLGAGWGANMPLRFPMMVTGSGPGATASAGLLLSS
jgi:hypothetical protein